MAQNQPAAIVPLNPGDDCHTPLNFTNSEDNKFHKMMIKAPETKFNGYGESVRAFLERVKIHVALGGMQAIFNIPDLVSGIHRNLLNNYGRIPIADVWAFVLALYTNVNLITKDNQILFHHLAGSMTEDFEHEIMVDTTAFTINVGCGSYNSGLLLLKVMLSQAQTDMVAMVMLLRRRAITLKDKMVEIQSNVTEFHTYVWGLVNDYAPYGVPDDELLANVIWPYEELDDHKFVCFVEHMKDDWNKARNTPLKVFMEWAEGEYKTRVQMGNW
jgi:hypothetical protein